MAVDPRWLDEIRQKNRKQFGMAGLGQGASDIAETLQRARSARRAEGLTYAERQAAIRAQEVTASDPRTAALLAMPKIEIPEARPIPKSLLIAGGVIAAGLLAVIFFGGRK